MDYDQLLDVIGTFGSTQKFVVVYIFIVGIVHASNVLDIIFVLSVSSHNCDIGKYYPNITNGTHDYTLSGDDDYREYFIPVEIHDGISRFQQCSMYARSNNSSLFQLDVGNNTSELSLTSCVVWSYYNQPVSSSLVDKVRAIRLSLCVLMFLYQL